MNAFQHFQLHGYDARSWDQVLKTAGDAQGPAQAPASQPLDVAAAQKADPAASARTQIKTPAETPAPAQPEKMSIWGFGKRMLIDPRPEFKPANPTYDKWAPRVEAVGNVVGQALGVNTQNPVADMVRGRASTEPEGIGTMMRQRLETNAKQKITAEIQAEYAKAKQTGDYSRMWQYAQQYPEAYDEMRKQTMSTAMKWGGGLLAGGLGLSLLLPKLWGNKPQAQASAPTAQTPGPRMDAYRLS